MTYIHYESTKQFHQFLGLHFGLCYFLESGNFCPEGHPCLEATQVSFDGKMAVVVYLVAEGSLSPWHNLD